MAHTAKCVWSEDLGQLAHFYMYEILLIGSNDNLSQMAKNVSLMELKLSTHLSSTEGYFSNECYPCDIIRDSLRCGRGVTPLIFRHQSFYLIISNDSYLILNAIVPFTL